MNILNGYLQVQGASIFNTRMLTGRVRVYIHTRGYPYPLYSNLNLTKNDWSINILILNELFFYQLVLKKKNSL